MTACVVLTPADEQLDTVLILATIMLPLPFTVICILLVWQLD